TGASTSTPRGAGSGTTWPCRATSTRWRSSRRSPRSADVPPPSSARRRAARDTSSTSATASCRRRRSTTCAPWSTPCTSSRRADGRMAADAVLLIAFGGPTRPEEVAPFLANVVRGRGVPPERLAEVARHYHAIGGRSPLGTITFAQAEKLGAALEEAGVPLPVYVGMRNW